ncbi:MAG: amino acid ABC transporter permease [Nitriliruptorales bacterium]
MSVTPETGQRPPPWRNIRVLRAGGQAVFLLLVFGFLYFLYFNLVTNLLAQGIGVGFGYLRRPSGFNVPGALHLSDPVWFAILRGAKNTALVSFLGIVIATVLGITVGVMRLSTNWLVARVASLYVEALRNIPVLLIIIFWFIAVMLKLPPRADAFEWFGGAIILSNRGLAVPWVQGEAGLGGFWALLGVAVIAGGIAWRWRTRRNEATGAPHHRMLWTAGVVLVILVVGYFALGRPFVLSVPSREGRLIRGGFGVSTNYAALLVALAIYTASHIAEIVRGSILSVPKGQVEAATAVGLTGFQRLRHVVLPQAFRVAVPPIGNQFLNLTKNSSLGVAIAFPELTRMTRVTVGNGMPAPQSFAVAMLIYLAFSFFLAGLTNVANRRLQFVER